MSNRSKHTPIYVILIGFLAISFGFNILFYNRILILQEFVRGSNPWITTEQIDFLEQEIKRLENTKYQMVPKGE